MKVFNLYWSSLNVCCYSYFGKGSKSLIHPITYIALTNTPTHTIQSTPLGPTLGSVATTSECTVEELGIKSTPPISAQPAIPFWATATPRKLNPNPPSPGLHFWTQSG